MVLTLLSAIFYNRIYIDGHVFSLPVFFSIFSFLSVLILFTVTPLNSTAKTYVHGWKKYVASVLILLCACFAFYLGIYTPLNSRLVLEIPIQQEPRIDSISFTAEKDKKYFIAVDYSERSGQRINTVVRLTVSNETWTDDFQMTLFNQNEKKRTSNATKQVNLPFVFPENGNYSLSIEQSGNLLAIKRIRVFVRE